MDLKNNKVLAFAVGVTTVILLLRWLLTGDLLFAVNVAMSPPEEGDTQGPTFIATLWPMFFDAMVVIGTAVIAWAFKLWDAIYAFIQKQQPNDQARVAGGLETQAGSPDGLVQGLARAAATNDVVSLAKLQVAIRKPYAINELNQAYAEGDAEKAKKLVEELNAMIERDK